MVRLSSNSCSRNRAAQLSSFPRKKKLTLGKTETEKCLSSCWTPPSPPLTVCSEKLRADAPKNKANLILFLADKDPSTSLSWCPDCVRAEPVIYKRLEATPDDVALLRVYVGDTPTWRNPMHPWQVDSRFKLTGVPTLVCWENDAIKGRFEDHEAQVEGKIDALVAGN